MSMRVRELFDEVTFTLTYVVWDAATRDAVIIDSVLDYDPVTSRVTTRSAERVFEAVDRDQLQVRMILETHAHADHLSGAQVLKRRFDAPIAISERIAKVQDTFRSTFALDELGGFDRLLQDGEELAVGSLKIHVLPTPGHTPACVSYRIDGAVFVGDALFVEDYGTGRTDFPGGSARDLYHSVHDVLYQLPDDTRVFVGHDYQPNGRAMRCETTIGLSKRSNVQLREETTEQAFVEFRAKRDAALAPPKLLSPSLQVNINAGRLPARGYFAVPFTAPPELRVQSGAWSQTRISAAPPARRAAGT